MIRLKYDNNNVIVSPLIQTKTVSRVLSMAYSVTVDSIEFNDKDADLIINAPFHQRFELIDFDTCEVYEFYKSKCNIQRKNRLVKVRPKTIDNVEALKKIFNDEINIIDLPLKSKDIRLPYAPAIQFSLGIGKLITIISDIVYESDIVNPIAAGQGWFNHNGNDGNTYIHVESNNAQVSGFYRSTTGDFKANRLIAGVADGMSIWWTNDGNSGNSDRYVIFDASLNRLYESDPIYPHPDNPLFDSSLSFTQTPIVLTSLTDPTDQIIATSQSDVVFRILTVNENWTGYPLVELGFDDATPPSPYTHAIDRLTVNAAQFNEILSYFDLDTFTFSELSNDERGEYGRFSDLSFVNGGKYFVKPQIAGAEEKDVFPIMQNFWNYGSIWFHLSSQARDFLQGGVGGQKSIFYDYKDLLEQMTGQTVTSAFLDGNSPMKDNRKLWFTPISNVKERDYQSPATKQLLKPKDAFDFLEFTQKLYFDTPTKEGIRIEHYSFYDNGGSYSGKIMTVDLSSEVDSRNRKPIESEDEDHLDDKLKRFIYTKFQNDHNILYEGNMQHLDDYVSETNDERVANKMNVDLMSILLNDTGYDGIIVLEFDENDEIIYQNGLINGGLAMTYCNEKYHRHGAHSENTTYGPAFSLLRIKEEEIIINIDIEDYQKLIRTSQGFGKIETLVQNKERIETIKLMQNEY